VVHVAAVPDRLEDAVAEAEDQQVADGLLAQVVVDAVDLRLAEDLLDLVVERVARIRVAAERLLDDDRRQPEPRCSWSSPTRPIWRTISVTCDGWVAR
jgi:hypothetical protein